MSLSERNRETLRAALYAVAEQAIYRTAHNGPAHLCGLIADGALALLDAARSEPQAVGGGEPRPYPFASPSLKYSEAFVFEGGSLTVNTTGYGAANGTGWLCFLEKELEWEQGDNGQDYRIANLDRSELVALRDKLNEVFPALTFTASLSDASPSSGDE